jgi:hypothetical protein
LMNLTLASSGTPGERERSKIETNAFE